MDIEIKHRFTGAVILCGKYESIKDALEKNRTANLSGADLFGAYLSRAYLSGADLSRADLFGAYLSRAYLSGADLSRADLSGAKQYVSSHDIFSEIIKRQKVEDFTNSEWSMIGIILVHRVCWDTIKKRYGEKIMPVFKKLEKIGFGEWAIKYAEILSQGE